MLILRCLAMCFCALFRFMFILSFCALLCCNWWISGARFEPMLERERESDGQTNRQRTSHYYAYNDYYEIKSHSESPIDSQSDFKLILIRTHTDSTRIHLNDCINLNEHIRHFYRSIGLGRLPPNRMNELMLHGQRVITYKL